MESSRVVGCNIVVTECGEEQVRALEEKGFHMLCRDGDLSRFVLARV